MDRPSQRNFLLFKEAAREIANYMRNEPRPFAPADRGFWIVEADEAGDLLTLDLIARDDFAWNESAAHAGLRGLVDGYDLDRQVVVLIRDPYRPGPNDAAVLWRPGR